MGFCSLRLGAWDQECLTYKKFAMRRRSGLSRSSAVRVAGRPTGRPRLATPSKSMVFGRAVGPAGRRNEGRSRLPCVVTSYYEKGAGGP
jgi:hypothetical protein